MGRQWRSRLHGERISVRPGDCVVRGGGAIIAWTDLRGANANIYAQRLDAFGDALWNANGVSLCAAAGEQVAQAIVSDGSDGAIVGMAGPAKRQLRRLRSEGHGERQSELDPRWCHPHDARGR